MYANTTSFYCGSMKIGFDAKRLFNNYTGLGNYSRTLVKNLSELYPQERYQLYTPKINPGAETLFFTQQPNIEIIKPNTKLLGSYWRTYQLAEVLDKDQIDLYHGLSHELPVGIKTKSVKTVVTIHDLIFKIYPNTYPWMDRLIYEKKFKYSCEVADHIVAISQCTKNDLVRFYKIDPAKITVAYQSCNPLFFQTPRANKEQVFAKHHIPAEYILYVGAVAERKNIETLLKAYHILPASTRVPLVIVGNGKKYMNTCMRLAKELNIENQIHWITRLHDNAELQVVYQHALCFVYPSFYEGFGIPIIEALLSKTPVVAAKGSCLEEAGGPDSMYFNPKAPNELSNLLSQLLSGKVPVAHVVNKGYDFALQNFSAQITTQKIFSVYKSLF